MPNLGSFGGKNCEKMEKTLKNFGIFTGPKNLYSLVESDSKVPSEASVQAVMSKINSQLRENPGEKFLINYMIAGHGLQY